MNGHAPKSKVERPAGAPGVLLWLQRRRWTLVWLAVMLILLATQWSIFKDLVYSVFGVPKPADGIAWRSDFAAAKAESTQSGKPILLDFYADWCPPCQAMKRDAWPDPQVRELVNNFYIPVALNIDSLDSRNLGRPYQLDSIPRIVIVDPQQKMLKTGGFMTRDALVQFLTIQAK